MIAATATALWSAQLGAREAVAGGRAGRPRTSDVAGWTRVATTDSYLIVANVLPAEPMYTSSELERRHPPVGEVVLAGRGQPVGSDVRHVETHIYDRRTGLPVRAAHPTIEVWNRTTGARTRVAAVLMQDINIGAPDVHFGDNVRIGGNADLTLRVTVGIEEATFDGHLD